jgi:hypothetical protein
MAHIPSSSSSSGASATAHELNPFHVAAPAPLAAHTVQVLNIRHHVPEVLDLHESNYSSWSSLFELTFRKLGLLDHVDGTVDAHVRQFDVEWTQIDHCIVSWIYLTVSKTIRDMVFQRRATAFSAWNAVRGLFLNNATQRAVYALQDFHSLQQGDLSVGDYCCHLKRLADTLVDVGHPVTDQDLVVNAMRDLSSKFSGALGVINAMHPLPSFLWVHNYLLQEETRMDRTHKMEAANALLAAGSAPSTGAAGAALLATTATGAAGATNVSKPPSTPPGFSPTKNGNERKKKRKQSDGKPRGHSGSAPSNLAPPQFGWTAPNPWTGVVQAWPVPLGTWRPPAAPGARPPVTP